MDMGWGTHLRLICSLENVPDAYVDQWLLSHPWTHKPSSGRLQMRPQARHMIATASTDRPRAKADLGRTNVL